MADGFEVKVIREFTKDISTKLSEAASIARVADGFGEQGFADRAFETLMSLETLVHDAATLLNATSVVRRRELRRSGDPLG